MHANTVHRTPIELLLLFNCLCHVPNPPFVPNPYRTLTAKLRYVLNRDLCTIAPPVFSFFNEEHYLNELITRQIKGAAVVSAAASHPEI